MKSNIFILLLIPLTIGAIFLFWYADDWGWLNKLKMFCENILKLFFYR